MNKGAFCLNHRVKWMIAAFLSYCLSVVISTIKIGFHPASLERLENFVHPLLAVFLLIWLFYSRPHRKWLWIAIGLAAIGSGLYAGWEILVHDAPQYRAGGSKGKPIPFGEISIVLSFLSLLLFSCSVQFRKKIACFFAVSTILGFWACITSDARGALLFMPAGLVMVLLFWLDTQPRHRKSILLCFAVFCLLISAPMIGFKNISNRSHTVYEEFRLFTEGVPATESTSVVQRLELWKSAWQAFSDNPLLGLGVGQYHGYLQSLREQGQVSDILANYGNGRGHTHAHSDYMHALATRGILGFLTLLGLYLVPFFLFYQKIRETDSVEDKVVPYAGIISVLAFVTFSLTDSAMLMKITSGFYITLICWLLVLESSESQFGHV